MFGCSFYKYNFFFFCLGRFPSRESCFKQSYDMKTPLEYFLCKAGTISAGSGLMALVDFLAFQQNEFLEQYKRLPGSMVTETSLTSVKEADLVTYTTKEDLLPLVYTHCDYTLELGKGTKIDYNLDKIFQLLTDKIFYGKSRIVFAMKEFVYRDDVHSARKFTNLKNKVEQV